MLLAGNLEVDSVDYSQWQRKSKRPASVKKHKNLVQNLDCDIFTVQPSISSASSRRIYKNYCHNSNKPELTPRDLERENRLLSLRTRITEKEKHIANNKLKVENILRDNATLRINIDTTESTTHAKVKHLLRKYEQFRGGILVMNNDFIKEKNKAEVEIADITNKENHLIKELEEQVSIVADELNIEQKHLQLLMNYKDTEYPMKFLQKTELEFDIMRLKKYNQIDEDELKRVVSAEIHKFRETQASQLEQVASEQRAEVSQRLHPSLVFMDKHNHDMLKEVKIHTEKIEDLVNDIESLKSELKCLRRNKSVKDLRKIMFPDIFIEPDEKCTPDMDITLDIVRNKCLPI